MITGWDEWYHKTLAHILVVPESKNERTGEGIKALPCRSFALPVGNTIPVLSTRRMFPVTAAAEVAWQLMGTQSTKWISKYCKIWDKFADEDGNIETAYGYRWYKKWNIDQIGAILGKLKADPSSRQAHVQTWDVDDLVTPKKNVPCPTCFTVNIMEYLGRKSLHVSVHVRSSDFIMGLPYDVMSYALLQKALATTLGLPPGMLQFTLAHAHVYSKHNEVALQMIDNYNGKSGVEFVAQIFKAPDYDILEIEENPDRYVEAVVKFKSQAIHPYNPKPELFV